jgi:pentatricopeptide repeat protein
LSQGHPPDLYSMGKCDVGLLGMDSRHSPFSLVSRGVPVLAWVWVQGQQDARMLPTVVTYNTVMGVFIKRGLVEAALGLRKDMARQGLVSRVDQPANDSKPALALASHQEMPGSAFALAHSWGG